MMSSSLVVHSVSKSFGSNLILDRTSLEVSSGETVVLMGASGCGKSTLLRVICGLETPDAGSISLDDTSISHLPPERRNMSLVFQNYALWPHLSVRQNISFGLEVKRRDKKSIDSAVDSVARMLSLTELLDRFPHQLSGGQQQRVSLARGLSVDPAILLLDEPLSNLDVSLRAHARRELKHLLSNSAVTAIYVTHDSAEALSLADRIAIMHHGSVIQIGTPQQIYNSPVNRYTAALLGEINVVPMTPQSPHSANTSFGDLTLQGAESKTLALIRPEAIKETTDRNRINTFAAQHLRDEYYGSVIHRYYRCGKDELLVFSSDPSPSLYLQLPETSLVAVTS